MSRFSSADAMPDPRIPAFVAHVAAQGERLFREFPWRETHDPYAILVSEVMLQQTQVARVVPYYERWLADFPSLEALAATPLEAVLRAWQGLGYNRRAIALKRCAEEVVRARLAQASSCQDYPAGPAALPSDDADLRALPGIGPATAAGVRAFGFGLPSAYLETNVRTVFLHELFADADGVPDSAITPLVAQAAEYAETAGITPREWNYALLDYGAHLKRTVPNPSRRSAHHIRQDAFEGSRRQKRARLLRAVMEAPGATTEEFAADLSIDVALAGDILSDLAGDGFIVGGDSGWTVAETQA